MDVRLLSREHVDHKEIASFAEERVNLKRDDATELRRQANLLRDRLETYLADHPDFEIRKMLLSGSLAKGTALKSVSDIDVACYVSSDTAPHKIYVLRSDAKTASRTIPRRVSFRTN